MSIDIRQAVLADIETKIAAGEELRATIERQEAAARTLADADAAVVEARKSAIANGWSEAELKKLKLIPQTRTARSRAPRSSRTGGE